MTEKEILEMFKFQVKDLPNELKFEEIKDIIDGAHNKEFVMIDKSEFNDLYSKKSKQDKYITYIDNIRKDGIAPRNISILKKTLWSKGASINEVFASRLMNYYDCPTVYNVPFKATEGFNFNLIASVDCVSGDETFDNIYRYIHMTDDRAYTIWRRMEMFFENQFSNFPHFKEDFSKVEYDFFKSHIVREFIVGDNDMGSHNIGLLLNDKEKRFRIVNFDYENSFVTKRREFADFNFEYVLKHKPDIIKEIIDKSITLRESLLTNMSKFDNSDNEIKVRLDNLLTNLNAFMEMYNSATQENIR